VSEDASGNPSELTFGKASENVDKSGSGIASGNTSESTSGKLDRKSGGNSGDPFENIAFAFPFLCSLSGVGASGGGSSGEGKDVAIV
jgi:hypothetical protein